jgi:hypothetical protein
MNQIIRAEKDGVEFFTVAATGESGMSQSGLTVLSGVPRQTLQSAIKSLAEKSPSKALDAWVGKSLILAENCDYKNATIYSSAFCAAVIRHYAYQGIEVAQYSLDKFADIGINAWIQGITQWDSTPVDLQNIIATAQKFLGQYVERQGAIEERQGAIEERQGAIEIKHSEIEQLVHQHDGEVNRIFHPDGRYFSIRAWAKLNQIRVSKQEAASLGRLASKLSKQLGVYIDKLEDPRYGEVNIYHETILRQAFESEEGLC